MNNVMPIHDNKSAPCHCKGSCAERECVLLPVAIRSNSRRKWGFHPSEQAMAPEEALERLKNAVDKDTTIGMVGINGPGDPLAAPEPTLRTLKLVHESFPDLSLGLGTIGFNAAPLAGELASLGVERITVMVDALDPEIITSLYSWIRPGTRTLPPTTAAMELAEAQEAAIKTLVDAGITVEVESIIYPGVNDGHLSEVAVKVKEWGASSMRLLPFVPTGGEGEPGVSSEEFLDDLRRGLSKHITLAAGAGLHDRDMTDTCTMEAPVVIPTLPTPLPGRPNVAVTSVGGHGSGPASGARQTVSHLRPARRGRPGRPARNAPRPDSGQRRRTLGSHCRHPFRLLRPAHLQRRGSPPFCSRCPGTAGPGYRGRGGRGGGYTIRRRQEKKLRQEKVIYFNDQDHNQGERHGASRTSHTGLSKLPLHR